MAIINYLPFGGTPAPEKRVKYEYTGVANYTESGTDDWELEFDSSGTFTPYETIIVDIFAVGGGGGGSYGPVNNWTSAGGGGGNIFYQRKITLQANQPYSIVIGAGGAGGTSSAQAGGAGGDTCLMKGSTKLYTAFGATAQEWVDTNDHVRGGSGGSGGAAAVKWSTLTANVIAEKRGGENGESGTYSSTFGSSWSDTGAGDYYKNYANMRKFRSNSGIIYGSGGGHGGYNTGTYTIGAGGGGSGAGDGSSVSGTRGNDGSINRGGGGGGGWNSNGGAGGSGVLFLRKAKNFSMTGTTDIKINGETEITTNEVPISLSWTGGAAVGEDVGPVQYRIYSQKEPPMSSGWLYNTLFSTNWNNPASITPYNYSNWEKGQISKWYVYAGNPAVDEEISGPPATWTYRAANLSITAPSNLKINGATSSTSPKCVLTWTASTITGTTGITYHIFCNGTDVANTTSTTYTLPTATISSYTNVTITVKAYNEDTGYSTASNSVTYTYIEKATLSAPSNLKVNGATNATGSTCTLTWIASTLVGATGTITYEIWEEDGANLVKVEETTSTSIILTVGYIQDFSNTKLYVTAIHDEVGRSDLSNAVTFTYEAPAATITAPSNLRVNGSTSSTSSTCSLTWTASTLTNSTKSITYRIWYRAKSGSSGLTLLTTTTNTSITLSTSDISGWTAGVSICVNAYNEDAGYSNYSNNVSFTYEEAPSTTITAPSSLKINNTSASSSTIYGSSCSLSWTASTANPSQAITYYIYMGGSNVGTTTSTSYSVPSPSNYTSKTSVYIQAKAADGTWSSSSSTGYFQYAYVSNPSNLRVNGSISSTSSSCSLTWSAPATVQPSATVTYRIYVNNSSFATTTSTSYSFSSSTISSWTSARTIKVEAYTSYATCPGYSNEVTFTYKPASTNVTVAASKYATTENSSFANTGGSSCVVGRSTSSSPVGTAMKFNAPSGGWGSYSRAVLHVYRTGGSASATVIVGHLNQAYSATIYCDKFYYNNYTSEIGTVSVGAASTWFSLDITSYKPSGSGEWGITLTSKNAYATVNGTNAYITLS